MFSSFAFFIYGVVLLILGAVNLLGDGNDAVGGACIVLAVVNFLLILNDAEKKR